MDTKRVMSQSNICYKILATSSVFVVNDNSYKPEIRHYTLVFLMMRLVFCEAVKWDVIYFNWVN